MKVHVRRYDAMRRLRLYYWHKWFAWHPVKIGHRLAWLEWVQRRNIFWQCGFDGGRFWIYRFDDMSEVSK